jgi:hypothetical protein
MIPVKVRGPVRFFLGFESAVASTPLLQIRFSLSPESAANLQYWWNLAERNKMGNQPVFQNFGQFRHHRRTQTRRGAWLRNASTNPQQR